MILNPMNNHMSFPKELMKNTSEKESVLDDLVEIFLNNIKAILGSLEKDNGNFVALHDTICQLEQLIFDAEQQTPHLASKTLAKVNPSEIACLQQAYCKWETEIEWQFAHRLMSDPEAGLDEILNYKLYKRFETLIEHEVALLSSKPQRVLFIGSGPFPISGILLSQVLNIAVDCIEQEPEVVDFSRSLIERLGLINTVRVLCAEGQQYDLANYDLIMIALLAEPKYAILRNIRKKVALNCQVLCRTSFGLRTLLYKSTPIIERIGGFIPVNQQIADHEQTISTYLLQSAKHLSCELQWQWVDQLDGNLKAQITDLINRVLQRETTIGFPSPLDDREASELLAGLDESLKSGTKYLLIAKAGDQIVAHVILTPHPLPNCAHQIEVSRLVICPSFRGTGLLTQIAQKLVLKSEILGRSLMLLDVREGTLAHALWKSWKFKEYGRLPDYAKVNGKTYAGIFMYQYVSSLRAAVFP